MTISTTVQNFASLFAGRTDVWGALRGQAMKESVTVENYQRHLNGQVSLGIYPLRPDGRVRWFVIDIDNLDTKLPLAVLEALRRLGVNKGIYVATSRRKGFHVIVLLSDWALAADVRRIAMTALQMAGLPLSTEVFPKQDRLTPDTPYGSYLNIPYFGGGDPEGRRMVFDPGSLKPIPLQQWLANITVFDVSDLPSVLARLSEDPAEHTSKRYSATSFAEAVKGDQNTGNRRPTLVSLAGHLRNRGIPEEIALLLLIPWARQHFEPPLPDDELEKHIRGIYRRYGMRTPGRFTSKRNNLPTIDVGHPC